ncbi:MAG: glycosyltransferase family 4 protein [Sphingorhabdus sp.]
MVSSIRSVAPNIEIDIYAMVSSEKEECPTSVKTIILDHDRDSYRQAGIELDRSGAEVIWLQHEFGLFGGDAGEWIIDLLRQVAAPLAVSLHTVLENPNEAQRRVMDWFVGRASRLVVMSDDSKAILQKVYNADAERITIIPHGVPDRPFGRSEIMKERFGFAGKSLLMTFGLIGPGKGIETVIQAMPQILEHNPDAIYCVVGATHPKLIESEGETYRRRLEAQARELGVADNIIWVNRYLENDELLDMIEAADIYLTPYIAAAQSTSGTLAYALALGKTIVSTPYKHAAELLGDGVGVLVPFANPQALGNAVNQILADPILRQAMQKRAYEIGRSDIWPIFAQKSLDVCKELRTNADRTKIVTVLPETALFRLSDSCGMIQHSILSVPDRHHGYCVDDNARALMLAHHSKGRFAELASVFASFVQHSWNPDTGMFRNFMSYDRQWLESEGSIDSNGRTLWAIGSTIAHARDESLRQWACNLWNSAALIAINFQSPRAVAFAVLGADLALKAKPDNIKAISVIEYGHQLLKACYLQHSKAGWRWFEPYLAYDNCRLPEALLCAANHMRDDVAAMYALEALEWITHLQTEPAGHFRPIGSNAFGQTLVPGDPFDQQPVDAWAMIDAALAAYRYEPDDRWLEAARSAYAWFFGRNDRGMSLVETATGDCCDGVTPHGVNLNRGAESVLSLHLGQLSMQMLEREAGQWQDEPVNLYQPMSV